MVTSWVVFVNPTRYSVCVCVFDFLCFLFLFHGFIHYANNQRRLKMFLKNCERHETRTQCVVETTIMDVIMFECRFCFDQYTLPIKQHMV